MLNSLNLLDKNGKISITNTCVIVFLSITAIRSLFSGVVIETGFFTWKVEALDVSSTLPLLFGLLNYGHKRVETNKKEVVKE